MAGFRRTWPWDPPDFLLVTPKVEGENDDVRVSDLGECGPAIPRSYTLRRLVTDGTFDERLIEKDVPDVANHMDSFISFLHFGSSTAS